MDEQQQQLLRLAPQLAAECDFETLMQAVSQQEDLITLEERKSVAHSYFEENPKPDEIQEILIKIFQWIARNRKAIDRVIPILMSTGHFNAATMLRPELNVDEELKKMEFKKKRHQVQSWAGDFEALESQGVPLRGMSSLGVHRIHSESDALPAMAPSDDEMGGGDVPRPPPLPPLLRPLRPRELQIPPQNGAFDRDTDSSPETPVAEEIERVRKLRRRTTDPLKRRSLYGINEVKVEPAQKRNGGFCGNKGYKCYKMDSNPRGYALIINNENFLMNDSMQRKGSDRDLKHMKELLEQLHFAVEDFQDLGYADMRQRIRDFAAKPRHREMDCCVVVIMSHGHSDSGMDFVYSYDHKAVLVNWILNCFSNKNCPALMKKPKLFFIQACRGDSTDRGVTCYPYPAPHKSRRPSTDRDGSTRSDANMEGNLGTPLRIPAVGQKKLPSVTDTFLARATVPGYVCFRDTVLGTWFIQKIVEVFMERAKDCELRDLMNEVSERMAKLENEFGYKQAPDFSMLGGFSHLYFNPGLYGTLQLPTRLSRPDFQLTPPPADQTDRSPSPVRRVTAPAGSPPVWRRSEEANGSGGSSGASSMSHEGTAEDGHRSRRPGRGLMERARRWIRGDVRDTSSLSPSSRHRGQGDNGH